MPVILAFGDSNTHGTIPMRDLDDKGRHPVGVRWPSVMAQTLGPDFHVIEEGHPGRTTVHDDPTIGEHRNGVRVLPSLLESHFPIDLVIIMLGTNDLKTIFNAGPADIAAGTARLVRMINTSEAGPDKTAPRIMIVSPPPMRDNGLFAEMRTDGQAKSEALSPALAALAARLNLSFFDAGTAAQVDAKEGIHFDAENHIALGKAMAAEVSRLF